MPIKNEFYGVYKIAQILTGVNGSTNPSPYVIKTLNADNAMPTTPEFFMQGSPLTKILNIESTSESISIEAPILVPSVGQFQENLKDGRILLRDKVNNSYTNGFPNNILPILTSANIKIDGQASSVNLNLWSDGDPNNTVNTYAISDGTASLINQVGLNYAARVAKNWDFVVQLGELEYYIKNANVNINVANSKNSFLGVAANNYWPANYQTVPYDGTHNGQWPADTGGNANPTYTGWQFDFLSVGGVTIDVTGQALMVVSSENPENNVNFKCNNQVAGTRTQLFDNANVTLQNPGELTYTQDNFTIQQIYKDGSRLNVIPDAFAVNSAIISQKTASFTPQELIVNFKVQAFVGFV